MKRLICIVLAFVIFLGIGGMIAPGINNISKLKSASVFAEQVNSLVKQYESKQETQNRLIVNSNNVKDNYGAVKVVKGRGFQIMQFESYEEAENAKNNIEKLGIACDRDCYGYVEAVKKAKSSKDLWASRTTQSDVTMQYLKSTGQNLNDVTVGVMDTGINAEHEVFDGRIIECNKNFSSTGGINSPADDSGHGTGVAGVIALNSLDNVKIKPYKTFDKDGKCTNSQIVATLNYILSEKKLPDVINMSFSVQSITSSVTRDSLTRTLISRGVTVVTSAGNKGVNAKYYYPANIEEVITVSSSDKNNEKADFSNYGKCIDIAAPGTGVYTAQLDGTYSYENGTSFSAGFVSCAAAAILMQNKDFNCSEIEAKICNEAVPVYVDAWQVEWCGAGIVNFTGLIFGDRAAAPTFSAPQGKYNSAFELEINAEDNEKIMYTTDNTVPTSKNGIQYTEPIEINKDTHIIAVAYDNMKKSRYVASTYEIVYDTDDDDFDITQDGVLVGYHGSETNITVSQEIDSITVKAVGDNVFNDSNLKTIVLPDTVKTIGTSAFANSNLTTVTAKGVTTLENGAFENCQSLVSLDMGNVENVGNRCFKNCSKLTNVEFSTNVKELGVGAFAFTSLSNADFPNVKTADGAFEGTKIVVAKLNNVEDVERTFCECSLLSSVYIPKLKNVGNFSFYNCKSLETLDLKNVQNAGNYAFSNSGLKVADLPKCESLGNNAFYKCNDLVSVNIPLVTKIMPETFSYCSCIQTINMQNVESFDDISKDYFTDCIALKGLYLPKSINLPNISWSTNTLNAFINLFKKPQMTFVFAPRAVDVASGEGSAFMYKCSKLEYAVLTSTKSIDYMENIENCVWYFGREMTSLPDDMQFENNTVIASGKSYAADWAQGHNVKYVKSDDLKFKDIKSNYVSYIADGNEYKLPVEYVKSLWDVKFVNSSVKSDTPGALLDLNGDEIVNAKDFAKLNKA